jgi:alpha-tubulin suppressor-like RCC1 family protein
MHQLGLSSSIGPVPIATHPTLILIPNSNIVKVYGGFGHTLGLDNSGQVWSFGYNLDGQCGTGEQCDYVESPTLVSFGEEEGVKAVNAACGRVSSYVISGSQRALCQFDVWALYLEKVLTLLIN